MYAYFLKYLFRILINWEWKRNFNYRYTTAHVYSIAYVLGNFGHLTLVIHSVEVTLSMNSDEN